jgi:hypothetical protein
MKKQVRVLKKRLQKYKKYHDLVVLGYRGYYAVHYQDRYTLDAEITRESDNKTFSNRYKEYAATPYEIGSPF